ncbi:MAG: hypothetical protein SO445_04360 [Lachnospiraceae bacterium]|nr:hypothetical protein [Lachnospiraceae bacterium]MDY4616928.1 hypothetical protein [Lachnospiraceae bacterium]
MEHNYRLTDFRDVARECDTDILERIVSIDLGNVADLPAVLVHRLETIINKMIAEHEKKNNIIIPLEDMRLGMYMNIDTKENELSINVYIGYYSDKECITGKEIIIEENADYAEIKQYFFDVLQLCVNEQIKKIRKCA